MSPIAHLKRWIFRRLCSACAERRDQVWRGVEDFDRTHSWEYELWEEQPEALNTRCEKAWELRRSSDEADHAACAAQLKELAEAGHPFAMTSLAGMYQRGIGVQQDRSLAVHFYGEAFEAGSWLAGLYYARMMENSGEQEIVDDILESGVRNRHLPAFFWLAYFRFRRNPGRKTAQAVRPLLEELIGQQHHGARYMLSGMKLRGYYGLRDVREGYREMMDHAAELDAELEQRAVA